VKPSPYTPSRQAARRLGVSFERLIGMIHRGEFAARWSNGRWWVETAALEGLLQARRRGRPGSGSPGRAA